MTPRDDELTTLTRILGAIDEYVYVGQFHPDRGYRLLFQGPCRGRLLGFPDDGAARDAVWADYVHPEDAERFGAAHDEAAAGGALDMEYRLVGADGRERWVRDRGRVLVEDGRTLLYGSVLDVTAARAVQEELQAAVGAMERAHLESQRLSRIDPLTGVANRRMLPEVLDRRLAGGDPAVGVLLLDVDRFKSVNDAYGHVAGDAVLVAIADRIRATVRAEDVVARVGGEEFLVLLHGLADARVLRRLGEALRVAVSATPIPTFAGDVSVTVSIGAAVSDADQPGRDGLLAAADHALYTAKDAGRDRVVVLGDPTPPTAGEPDDDRLLDSARAVALGPRARDRMTDLAGGLARRLGLEPADVLHAMLAELAERHDRQG